MRERGIGCHEKHEVGGEEESCQCSLLNTPRPHGKSPLKLALKNAETPPRVPVLRKIFSAAHNSWICCIATGKTPPRVHRADKARSQRCHRPALASVLDGGVVVQGGRHHDSAHRDTGAPGHL